VSVCPFAITGSPQPCSPTGLTPCGPATLFCLASGSTIWNRLYHTLYDIALLPPKDPSSWRLQSTDRRCTRLPKATMRNAPKVSELFWPRRRGEGTRHPSADP